jgi:hypothetical protein
MDLRDKWIPALCCTLLLFSGCLQPSDSREGSDDPLPYVAWSTEIDTSVTAAWTICLPDSCPLRTIDPKNRVVFHEENATLLGIDLTVTYPHPNHPAGLPTYAFHELIVSIECKGVRQENCATFGDPRVVSGPSPIRLHLKGLEIPPGANLTLEFRIPDQTPLDEVVFEMDLYAQARLHGTIHYLSLP